MKRAIFVFFGVLVGSFIFVAGINVLSPVPDWGRAGEGIGILAVVFAVAVACDESRRRAAGGRRPGNGLPPRGPATIPPPPGHRASGEPASLPRVPAGGEAGRSGAATGGDEYTIVFRPCRTPMLACALFMGAIALLYSLLGGMNKPLWVLDTLKIPGPVVVGVCAAAGCVYFCLFLRNCCRGSRIVVDTSGIILPRRGRLTWDQINTVKLNSAGYIEFLGTVQIGLDRGRRIHISWYQMGCKARKLYEAIQSCFAEHERHARLERTVAQRQR